jgi:hypothetical protein
MLRIALPSTRMGVRPVPLAGEWMPPAPAIHPRSQPYKDMRAMRQRDAGQAAA